MIPDTRFTDSIRFESDIVYPFESSSPKFKKIKEFTKEELKQLIGDLKIANKYLVFIQYKYLYQHDNKTYLCEPIN
jgi:hypothetical protein